MSEVMTQNWWDNQALQVPDDVGMMLVELTHPDLLEPVRCAATNVDVVSNGITYFGWPAKVRLPTQSNGLKRGSLAIQNIDPVIGRTLRTLKGKIAVTFKIIERENPDAVVIEHGGLFLKPITWDHEFMSGDVTSFGDEGFTFPARRSTPERTPGIYVL